MKKFFKKAFIFIALGAMSLTTTSCDSDTVQEIVSMLITNLTNLNGQTYQYQCQGKAEVLTMNAAGEYNTSGVSQFNGVFSVRYSGATANVTVPAMKIGNVDMSLVTISGLALTAQNNYTSISVPDTGVNGEGSITVDGKTYQLSNIFVEEGTHTNQIEATATSQNLSFKTFQLFFGDNYEYVVSLTTVSGEALTQ